MEEEKFNQIKYQNEFIKQKYDRINLTVPKGKKEKIKAAAKAAGQSVNEYINSAIDSYINKQIKISKHPCAMRCREF